MKPQTYLYYSKPEAPEPWDQATIGDQIEGHGDFPEAREIDLEHLTVTSPREFADLIAKIGPHTVNVTQHLGRFTATYRVTKKGPRLKLKKKLEGSRS